MQAGRWGESRVLQARALAAARATGDAEALFLIASDLMASTWAPRQWPDLLSLALELAARPHDAVSQRTLEEFLSYAFLVQMSAGERERAEALWAERGQIASRAQDIAMRLMSPSSMGFQALLDGDLLGAAASAEQLIALGDELGSPWRGRVLARLVAFWPLVWLGRIDEAASLENERFSSRRTVRAPDLGVGALFLARQGSLAEAREQLRSALERVEISDQAPARLLGDLLQTAVLVGDREATALIAPTLEGVPATHIPLTAVTRHLGGAARLLGDRAAAQAHYASALDWATKLRFRPEIALTRFDLAELLLDDALASTATPEERERDRVEAMGHLDFAIAQFRAMKMQPSLERALTHKDLLKA